LRCACESTPGKAGWRLALQRPTGFHFDFFLLGITTFVSGILGLPAPNGLVPQAPVNTETLSVTKMVPVEIDDTDGVITEAQLAKAHSQNSERSGVHKVVRTRVVEQRVSHLAMGVRRAVSRSRGCS
jgi:hypothetical protein